MERVIYGEEIVRYDLDKYQDWLLSKKSKTEDYKWELLSDCISLHYNTTKERAESLYDEIFVETKYWKEPTKEQVENFPYWREDSYLDQKERFIWKQEGNIHPIEVIAEEEIDRTTSWLFKIYPGVLDSMIFVELTEHYYECATMLGVIDYLKELWPIAKLEQKPVYTNTDIIEGPNIQKAVTISKEIMNDLDINIKENGLPNNATALYSIIWTVEAFLNVPKGTYIKDILKSIGVEPDYKLPRRQVTDCNRIFELINNKTHFKVTIIGCTLTVTLNN